MVVETSAPGLGSRAAAFTPSPPGVAYDAVMLWSRFAALSLGCVGVFVSSACGHEVRVQRGAGDGDGDGFEGGDSVVDEKCYDACLNKGVPSDDCEAYCSAGAGKDGAGAAGTGSGKGTGAAGNSGTGGFGASGVDPVEEKSCIECWYDESEETGQCSDEAKACQASLACTQLQWCPVLCEKPGCWEECNEIIPSGVEPLRDLVECMVCDGGPCAEECADSVMLSYCE